MRAINSKIIKALDGKAGDYKLSKRDKVYVSVADGIGNRTTSRAYYLWNSQIFNMNTTSYTTTISIGVRNGAYQTVTTKNRINFLADAYGLPGIVQKSYAWSWSDGVPYTGTRTFTV